MKELNKTALGLKPSGIRRFFDLVSEVPDAISLSVGEPDFVTSWQARDYAIRSIQRGETHYTSNRGQSKLLEQIALYYQKRFDISCDPYNEILVTVGASEGIDIALRAIINCGDEVIVPDPSYVSYMPAVTLAGGVAVAAETTADKEFKLTFEALQAAITPRTKAVILPYPNNPTGAVMARSDLERIIALIKEHDLYVISDEIYAELTYGSRHFSIACFEGMRERTIIISGFSKAFAMTGWRLGYIIAPKTVLDVILKIHQYTIMCAPTASQAAAYCALKDGLEDGFSQVEQMRDAYDKRRLFMLNALNDMGLDCFEPKGAFYLFPSVTRYYPDGDSFAKELLSQKKVAAVPGSAFGQSGKPYIRCTYASSLQSLIEAAKRIKEFIGEKSV